MISARTWRQALVALLVAVPAGVAGGLVAQAVQQSAYEEARTAYDTWRPVAPPMVPEQFEQALADLPEVRVSAAADVADLIADEDLRQARTTLAGAEVPSYLMFVRDPREIEGGYTLPGALRLMEEHVEGPAHLVVLTTRGDTASRGMGVEAPAGFSEAGRGRPGRALVKVAREQATKPPQPLVEVSAYGPTDYYGGRVGGVLAGLFLGLVVTAPIAFGLDWLWRRRRLSRRGGRVTARKPGSGKVLP